MAVRSYSPGYVQALKRVNACREMGIRGTTLDLSDLSLTMLPLEVGQLTALETLNLSDNRLTTLPPETGQLTSLVSLNLSNNQVTTLPREFRQLKALARLHLRNNQLTTLSPEIAQLTALTELWLSSNRLATLPPEIGQLKALMSLYLSGNQLTTLPPEIGQLKALTRLDLYNNKLAALPPEISQLTALSELNLAVNQLTTLPREIGQLTSLTELLLFKNQLTALVPEIGQLTALTMLHLDTNQMTTLPPEIGQLTALTTLYPTSNRLTTLPPEIGQLSALTKLALNDNRLTTLPPEIGQLTALTDLHLLNNQLTTLPREIGELTALTTLWLSSNRLTTLPPEIGQLMALTELYLHDNPALGIPPEVLGASWVNKATGDAKPKPAREILDWYFRNMSAKAKRPILEGKVIFVGWGKVGKTSLRRRLINGSFDEKEDTTHKIEITPWPEKIRADNVKLHVWDFGGQEIMHATHQFFLTKRSLYVLVLAGREKTQGAQDAEYWLRLIKGFGGDSPAIVVLNKQHQCKFDLNRQSLQEKYPFIKGFIDTDCDPPLHLDELKTMILQEVDRLPELRREFDSKWMAIKDEVTDLKQKGRKRMAVSDYLQLCNKKKERDPQWQKWLLGFLHDLGVVVCFHEDHRLANDGVLDPQWVVDGLYKVLNEPNLKGGDGRVTRKQIRSLLPSADYSDDDVRVLIDLMEKFQLCFALNGSQTNLVVPELMTEQEANWKGHFPDLEKCLHFELKYDFLPEGLVPRFIVATHHLSQAGERWRSGVILRKGRNAALVRGDAAGSPPLVRIAVNGPVTTRRELLAIVRDKFEEINRSITGLEVGERVPVPNYNVEPLSYDDLVAAEAAGEKAWPIVVGGLLTKIPFTALLDGIEPKEKRNQRTQRNPRGPGINIEGDLVFGGKHMRDDHPINIVGDVYGQVGQTLTNCTNMVLHQAPGPRKDLLEALNRDVQKVIEFLPDDKKEEAPQVADDLEQLVKQATSEKPNRKWYSVSAEGLLDAAGWVKDFSEKIGGTILNLGKLLWPDYQLPKLK